MQILRGTKREITLMQWNEQLRKAEKRLADSKKCFELFGGRDDKQRIAEDEEKLNEIKKNMKKAIEFMDAHNIK